MLETAMLKVFSTEALWQIVNDAFQIHGGPAYFTSLPLERILRDTRISQIGEGANEVLTSFIALVGMRAPAMELRELWEALHHPWSELPHAWRLGLERVGAAVHAPAVSVQSPALAGHGHELSRLIWRFNIEVDRAIIHHREEILERQYAQERIAGAAMELFASACVLSRRDAELEMGGEDSQCAAELFLRASRRRVKQALSELHDNDDNAVTAAANEALKKED